LCNILDSLLGCRPQTKGEVVRARCWGHRHHGRLLLLEYWVSVRCRVDQC
jgi:hypothetical protein